MEAKCLSEPQRMSSDIINTLPQPIIETILCLLPIQDATRTSILSRDWRYKWTTIPKLVFHMGIVSRRTGKETPSETKNMEKRCKLLYVVYQVLLLHQGPIREFTLEMDVKDFHCFVVDQIVLYLVRNHALKKLRLEFRQPRVYKLPLCAFSLHQLTHLDLYHISLDHQPIFGGFPNLRSLILHYVLISTKPLLHLLSSCPSLRRLKMFSDNGSFDGESCCTIIELFECLPAIEHLDMDVESLLPMLVLDSVPKKLPTLLINLKCIDIKEVLLYGDWLCFLVALIKCSPNLKEIYLQLKFEEDDIDYDDDVCCSILEEYSDVSLEHLNELEIGEFSKTKHGLEFVKFILARSPKLEEVRLHNWDETVHQESEMLISLLQAECVSPAEIYIL